MRAITKQDIVEFYEKFFVRLESTTVYALYLSNSTVSLWTRILCLSCTFFFLVVQMNAFNIYLHVKHAIKRHSSNRS